MFLRMLKGQGRVDEVLDWVLDGRTPLLVTCVGDPTPIARRADGCRGAALPPGGQPQRRAAGGGRRCRRADRRGRRERRPARRAIAAPVRAAAASPRPGRPAVDRRRRDRRRPRDGGSVRARCRGHHDGHPVHELGGEPGPRQLEAGHRRLQRHAQHRPRHAGRPDAGGRQRARRGGVPGRDRPGGKPLRRTRSSRRSRAGGSTRRWSAPASRPR